LVERQLRAALVKRGEQLALVDVLTDVHVDV
jgi:hypothetical protein